MAWSNVQKQDMLLVAKQNFCPTSAGPYLPLLLGDVVRALKCCGEWYYGFLESQPSIFGIFPSAFVAERIPRNELSEVTSVAKTAVETVSSVVTEWRKICQRDYEQSGTLDIQTVFGMIKEIINWRSQITSLKLSLEEVKKLNYKIALKVDVGNRMLGADLVVRDAFGNELQADNCSVTELYKYHLATVERIAAEMRSSNRHEKLLQTKRTLGNWNLLLTFVEFHHPSAVNGELSFVLFDGKRWQFISEPSTVAFPFGSPANVQCPGICTSTNLSFLITDLGSKDLDREKFCLFFGAVKTGPFENRDNLAHRKNHLSSTTVRQTFAVAALDLTNIVNRCFNADPDESMVLTLDEMEERRIFVPLNPLNDDSAEQVLRRIVEAKTTSVGDIEAKGDGFWLMLQPLFISLEELKNTQPHLFSNPPVLVRKMGFPEVIVRDDVRNDLYVSLVCGDFTHCTNRSDKNVEVRICLVDELANTVVQNSIITVGPSASPSTYYTSSVFYHQDRPRWFETLKIIIPVEIYGNVHIQFSFRHRSSNESKDKGERPFAVSFIRLRQSNGTVIKDGRHDLVVYRLAAKIEDGDFSYHTLPATKADLEMSGLSNVSSRSHIQSPTGAFAISPKDYFTINTVVCSTSLTQNVDLLGLLEWETKRVNLKSSLESLMKDEGDRAGEEVVKFLQDILDVLFTVLINSNDYDLLVFDALVYVIGLIGERRYHNFKSVLDNYLQYHFSAALAYQKLIPLFKDYIDRVEDCSTKLLRTLKALEYLTKFIVRSRELYAKLKGPFAGQEHFWELIRGLFLSLTTLMLYQTDWSLLCQGAALKYIPHIVADVLSVFDQREFASVMANFIRNVPEDRLTKQKLMCLLDFVQSELIRRPEPRSILLPVMLESVKFQIENNEELELCAQILTATMEVLFDKRLSKSANSGTLLFIMRVALRPVVQVIVRLIEADDHVILGQYVALLLSLLEELDACTYRSYVSEFVTRTDLMDFITELLMLFRDLLSHPVFPADWFQMTFVQNSIILKILCYAASTVKARFLHEKFDYQVCSNFFQTAVSFITHKQLQLENFPAKKRKSVLERFRDMRLTCGRELVRSMWFSMNLLEKNEFIPSLVGSILEVTLIPVEEVRKLTIPIFFDMMVTEFYLRAGATLTSTPVALRGNFTHRSAVVEFETEFITKLDQLIDAGSGDAKYADTFVRLMMQLCSSHTEPLREEGMRVTRTVELLIGRLLDFRAVRLHHNNIHNRMSCTVSLLNFYYDIGHMDLYVKYLYKLYELHKQQENFVEAALTLALHADCLKWSDSPAKMQHLHSSFHTCRTQRDLKEAISLQMIELFDRGELWEKAIGVCQELQREYEHSTFEYDKLSDLLEKMSKMYRNILKHQRAEPEYFRVGFFGLGFPSFLQNSTFVYRGDGYERLADFAARIQAEFPRANLLNSLDPPSDETKLSGDQYLQINKVDPICDEQMKRMSGRIKDPHILWYHKCNEVQKFTFSRRISRRLSNCANGSVEEQQENEFGLMWLERSILVTSCLFPGILRWFPVTSESHFDLSPVEVAVESMTTTVRDLERLINDAELHGERSLKPLAAKLQGMLQPAVMGGIQNYEKVFFNESFTSKCNQKALDLLDILKDRIAAQVPLLEKGVYLHAQLCSSEQREFHCLLVSCFKEYKAHVQKHYGVRVSLLPENAVLDMPRAQSLQKQHSMDGYMFNDVRSSHSGSLASRKANSVRDWQGSTSTPWLLRSGMMTTFSGSSVPRRIHQKEIASRRKAGASSEKEITTSRTSTDSIGSAQSTDGHNYVLPIVLTEKLTPLRPPRPDSNVSKGSSQNPSNLSSNRFTSSLERLSGVRSSLLTFTNFDELSLTDDGEESLNTTPPPLPPRRDSGHVEASIVNSPLLSPLSPTNQRLPSMITVPRREKPLPPLPTKP